MRRDDRPHHVKVLETYRAVGDRGLSGQLAVAKTFDVSWNTAGIWLAGLATKGLFKPGD